MSHFIQNTRSLENIPMFSLSSKQVVMPKIKKYIKTKADEPEKSYRKQSKLLINVCKRFQKQQFEEIHNQNAVQIEKKFKKLKKKMHSNMEKQSVQNIFDCKINAKKLNIREIVKMRPQRIQLQKKYGNQILLKMQNFREAEQITRMKQNYKNWYDSEKNDRCNSPIFKKMTYLIQRANKQNILDQLPICKQRIQRHTAKQKGQNIDYSFQKSLTKNSTPYKRRNFDWGIRKEKFSIFNHNSQT